MIESVWSPLLQTRSKFVSARAVPANEPAITAMDKMRRFVAFIIFLTHFFNVGETAFIAGWACEGNRVGHVVRANQFFIIPRNWRNLGRAIAKIAEGGGNSLAASKTQQLMTALRKATRFCGPYPFYTGHLSSPKETSRTQCSRISMPQWPRQCLACQAGVSNRLQVRKTNGFLVFWRSPAACAGGGGDRRRQEDRPRLRV